jgi:SAM-dependent methyltransferase
VTPTTARDGYIHGTAPSEQQRLVALNRMTNAAFVQFLAVAPGTRVLEVGSGLGVLAADVAAAAASVEVLGIEKASEQLAAAPAVPGVTFLKGDAHHLEFADETFDLVYARYLLEHVGRPEQVVTEMRRVARIGGRVAVCENDITLVRLDPPCFSFETVWNMFGRYQERLGGDALIGRRLYRLFRSAGFSRIELSVQPEVHWSGSPGFEPWVRNLIGNLESGRQGLLESGMCDRQTYDKAVSELTSLIDRSDGSAHFMWNRAMAVRTEA